MKKVMNVSKKLLFRPILTAMAFVDDNQKLKTWCLNLLSNHPILSEKLLQIHRNQNVISRAESNLKELDTFFSGSGSSLPELTVSTLPPKALQVYEQLKAAKAHLADK